MSSNQGNILRRSSTTAMNEQMRLGKRSNTDRTAAQDADLDRESDSRAQGYDNTYPDPNAHKLVEGQSSLRSYFKQAAKGAAPSTGIDGHANYQVDDSSELLPLGHGNVHPGGFGGPGQHGKGAKQYLFKPKRHPKSLLKEGVSTVRYLVDPHVSIFQVIMPWRQEQEAELNKKLNKKDKKDKATSQASINKWVKPQAKTGSSEAGTDSTGQVPRILSKEEEKYQ